mgnify:CR=1 FL=1
MILDLEPIFNNEGMVREFSYELDLSDQELSGAKPFTTPVKVSGSAGNYTDIVELRAKAEFVLDMDCDRCAKEIKVPLEMDFFHTLVTHLNDETNDELLLVNELRFDLDPLITEDIFLDMPAKFLCKDDCLGLCPNCGENLNHGECKCKNS